jgi:hypothetical protein
VTTDDGQRHGLSYEDKHEGALPQPQSEYLEVRGEWMHELSEYGWADEKAGTVRLPIEDAITRYAESRKSKQQGQAPQNQSNATGAQ